MHLHSSYPFWLINSGIIKAYPPLQQNITTGVVVIGAGITGALASYYLTKAGYAVTVVDQRHVGMGSTAASTALLQYEIDLKLTELAQIRGFDNALKSYKLCLQTIDTAKAIAKDIKDNTFTTKPSLQYASYKKDVKGLYDEYVLRKQHGFPVKWLEAGEIKEQFGIKAPGGLMSAKAATIDPFVFTHKLIQYATHKGAQVFEATGVTDIQHGTKNITLQTNTGCIIKTKYLVMASGYESGQYLPKKVEKLTSTYAIISQPMLRKEFWYMNALMWETARPYLYIRTTKDNRIIIGGKDDEFSDSRKRDAALNTKTEMLLQTFGRLLPDIPFVVDFAWSGVFGSTRDSLPYIGRIKHQPNTFYTLGYGGNGIIFSIIAGQIIADLIQGKQNEHARLFSFERR